MNNQEAKSIISCIEPMSKVGPMKVPSPFLFLVYHKDNYPAGNGKMEAPRVGNGSDFNPSSDYRMYHGRRIPGFPQHPHRGFETITATITGLIDHCDSAGNGGRYGEGDLQWMTAGKGIVHSEMFPLLNDDKPNPLRFFQIWINLRKNRKMVESDFVMHWAEDVKNVAVSEGVNLTIWAGQYENITALEPPVNSYAHEDGTDVAIYYITIEPGCSFTIPPAEGGSSSKRTLYFIEGDHMSIDGKDVSKRNQVEVDAAYDCAIINTDDKLIEILVLQGKPIDEPVVQYGPFVMNTQQEIRQAFSDYQQTQFGGWPWDRDDQVHPKEKGRFAVSNGNENFPPVY
eukprot:TRINITY_DN2007_c3_g1_i1.p1 TRINITY_DN2007_c3_g1~~TRINITY_DN2007_c3_g1_i1.p1  ORF type:complete len:342 (+),score=85.82 TRINITY_DN2007_c3_g1_i1:30-1055(+)